MATLDRDSSAGPAGESGTAPSSAAPQVGPRLGRTWPGDPPVARWRHSGLSRESRRVAGGLLIVMPTVVFGGASLLTLLVRDPAYAHNALRQDLWRAGHAHAGVLLVLSLIALRYVDEARLSGRLKWVVRGAIPAAAILLPAAFFLSVLSPDATAPNGLIALAYPGGISLAAGLLLLGIGLVRSGRTLDAGDGEQTTTVES